MGGKLIKTHEQNEKMRKHETGIRDIREMSVKSSDVLIFIQHDSTHIPITPPLR